MLDSISHAREGRECVVAQNHKSTDRAHIFVIASSHMTCIDDHGHFLAITGSLIAALGYFTPFLAKSTWWFIVLIGMVVSQIGYALLAFLNPDIWSYNLGTALGIMAIIFCFFILFACMSLQVALLFGVLVPISAVVTHNSMVLTAWVRENVSDDVPEWLGAAILVALALIVVVLVYVMKVVTFVKAILSVVVSVLIAYIYLVMDLIESDGSEQLCCSWSDPPTNGTSSLEVYDNSRCPLSIDTSVRFSILACLSIFSIFYVWICYSRRCVLREEKKKKTKKKETTSA